MSVPSEALTRALPLRIAFSGTPGAATAAASASSEASPEDAHGFPVGVPCLGGVELEEIFPPVLSRGTTGDYSLFESGELLIGVGSKTVAEGETETCAGEMYGQLLSLCKGRPLYRIWNYVPRLNEEAGGLELYRAFCRGRSVAFENAWGANYKADLPAASAVGCDENRLSVIFVAGKARARHVENPEQVPAYEYPHEHGPRAPSFSRGTVATANGTSFVFISGTAAIKGHATVAPGALDEQITCTIHNLRLISRACGIGDDLGAGANWTRHFKIYLRHPHDLEHAKALLGQALLRPSDRVTWLRADVCRAALNVEIEATLVRS